ncbi:MAG: TetR/AcrR family transcriptional regulator [Rhizobiaceae bacterium]
MTDKMKDRRFRRTRESLRLAMVGLLHETNWDEISIQMICNRADVARSSFYVHFDNKIALLDHVFFSREDEIKEFVTGGRRNAAEFLTLSWLVDHICESRELYYFASRSLSGQIILSRFKGVMGEVFRYELNDMAIAATNDQIDFVLGGAFAMIEHWIDSGTQQMKGQFKHRIYELARRVIDVDDKIHRTITNNE